MSGPWLIEYEGALYHILSRGNEQWDIFYDDNDRDRARKNHKILQKLKDINSQCNIMTPNLTLSRKLEITRFGRHY